MDRRQIEQEFPDVVLIRSEVNLGSLDQQTTWAFQAARGRYIVLLNSDAFLAEGSLQRSVEHMDRNPQAGLGGDG